MSYICLTHVLHMSYKCLTNVIHNASRLIVFFIFFANITRATARANRITCARATDTSGTTAELHDPMAALRWPGQVAPTEAAECRPDSRRCEAAAAATGASRARDAPLPARPRRSAKKSSRNLDFLDVLDAPSSALPLS